MVAHPHSFQSLLSQGISLLAIQPEMHQYGVHGKLFQSLLSQGISLLNSRYGNPMADKKEKFQSLLSQGISLLINAVLEYKPFKKMGFNPFLVRASVYWCIDERHVSTQFIRGVSIPS